MGCRHSPVSELPASRSRPRLFRHPRSPVNSTPMTAPTYLIEFNPADEPARLPLTLRALSFSGLARIVPLVPAKLVPDPDRGAGIHYALPYDKLPAARLYGFPLSRECREPGGGYDGGMKRPCANTPADRLPDAGNDMIISIRNSYLGDHANLRARSNHYPQVPEGPLRDESQRGG